jgi:uncharacterized SAM-dependent methyltransferase
VSPTGTSSPPTPPGSSPDSGSPVTETALFREVVRSLSERPRRLPPSSSTTPGGPSSSRPSRGYPSTTRRARSSRFSRRPAEVARRTGPRARVVEFGSGSGDKTARLLHALDEPAGARARRHCRGPAPRRGRGVPGRPRRALEVLPLVADYTLPWDLPAADARSGRTLFFFPGSTLGNFEPHEARGFLANLAHAGGRLGPPPGGRPGQSPVRSWSPPTTTPPGSRQPSTATPSST